MIRFLAFLIYFSFFPFSQRVIAQQTQRYCHKKIRIHGEENIKLTEAEESLLCGESKDGPWSEIPRSQQEYFLRRFLEARGYYSVLFIPKAKHLHVETGAQTLLREIQIIGSPLDLHVQRAWELFGRPLTRESLNALQKWVVRQLAVAAYPCAKVELKAFPEKNLVEVHIRDSHPQVFSKISAEPIPKIIGGVERRYDPFEVGDPYNQFLLDLSAKRMMDDELVISTNFATECQDNGQIALIEQKITPGEPRLFTFGLGFDTEELAMIQSSWKNSRFTPLASSLHLYARASYRVQTAGIGFNWYYAPIVMHHYLKSNLTYRRENEAQYDSRVISAKSGPAWHIDFKHFVSQIWLGLGLSQTELVRGKGLPTTQVLSLDIATSLGNHDFEYCAAEPRSGFNMDFDSTHMQKAVGSDYSLNKYHLNLTYLANLFSLDPPIWIFGLRGDVSTLQIAADTTEADIPTNLRLRLGGSKNLRGFSRNRIPKDGALTSAYAGGELRVQKIFPFGVQPLFFVDWGRVGYEYMLLEDTNFWSPGTGIHWQSPIGTFRFTVAYGLVGGEQKENLQHLQRWNIYLSYGEQF